MHTSCQYHESILSRHADSAMCKSGLQLIKDLGSWPATTGDSGTWDESSWNLFDQLVYSHKWGMSKPGSGTLFIMSVVVDDKNVDKYIIRVSNQNIVFFYNP